MASPHAPLYWLPAPNQWQEQLKQLNSERSPDWTAFSKLAAYNLDFAQTGILDRVLAAKLNQSEGSQPKADVRLAVLGSSTTSHLNPALRVAALRRNLWLDIYTGAFGQYWQEIVAGDSPLQTFEPTCLLFALDGYHLANGLSPASTEAECSALIQQWINQLTSGWQQLQDRYRCQIIQQIPLPIHESTMGNNEHQLPGSKLEFCVRIAAAIRSAATQAGVDVLAVDRQASWGGLANWHDPRLWHHAKMEIAQQATPLFAELVLRVITAKMGLSAKCLVLDLDNTLWGGEVGELGVEGIALGQGSPLGESFQHFQNYLLALNERGVILAVCSKNDHGKALSAFQSHPEMILKPEQFASFKANWEPKPDNLQAIAQALGIGLDSMVFVDDSPFERDLVRRCLPQVKTPEMPEEPSMFARLLMDAGYFESTAITQDDRNRSAAYQANQKRSELKHASVDLMAYLSGLEMRLSWKWFDPLELTRLVQLINKTNQFNLTTRRYQTEAVQELMADPNCQALQFRLLDRFGDNGLIAVAILRRTDQSVITIDSLLMSCRVLGRKVEYAILNIVAGAAKALGATQLTGEFIASGKNELVRNLYPDLGFEIVTAENDAAVLYQLDLTDFQEHQIPVLVEKADS